MLKSLTYPADRTYRSNTQNEPIEFFLDCFPKAKQLDLLLGYFSSSAINLLATGFAQFIYGGGTLRMVINDVLNPNDKQALQQAEYGISEPPIDLENLYDISDSLSRTDQHFFNCIAYLIAQERIQIKIIRPKNERGISHFKSGIFTDGESTVSFSSSCNFTRTALVHNLENLECKLSWENHEPTNLKIKNEINNFNNYFDELDQNVEYIDASEIKTAIIDNFETPKIEDLLLVERELIQEQEIELENPRIKRKIAQQKAKIEKIANEPKFPYEAPRAYQVKAYQNWVQNDYKGVFAMATGTGKTLTSLNCLLNIYKKTGIYQAIILVPTVALVNQWEQECKKFRFKNIVKVSTKNKWTSSLSNLITLNLFSPSSFICITTYASFVNDKFQSYFKDLPNETVLIADEAHTMGANKISKMLPTIHLQNRIGLSATPNRKYDDTENVALQEFFNSTPPSYTFSYPMEDAIKNGVLCEYLYYPHIVELLLVEFEEYKKISKELAKYIDSDGKHKAGQKQIVEMLRIKRKRIIHKAENKKSVLRKIIRKEYAERGNLKNTIVYVPEGANPNYEENDHFTESYDLINEYTGIVANECDNNIFITQFTAKTQNREKILSDFSKGNIHVLTSMKCLDEGVDIPRTELAIFCASTGNPRQFIQRRGRVLRTHPKKARAVIHDMVVVPSMSQAIDALNLERNLVKGEIERVKDFAELAINHAGAYEAIEPVLDFYKLSFYN